MNRKPTLQEALKLQSLIKGEVLKGSSLTGSVFNELIAGIHLIKVDRFHYRVTSGEYLKKVLRQKWNIENLDDYVTYLEKEDKDRIETQKMFRDSKEIQTSTFQGFLVNSLDRISYTLNGVKGELPQIEGSYLFISEYETFTVDDDITIVYVENFTTFKHIIRYLHLFDSGKFLFVSRLLSSNAFKNWLKNIPNKYIHFGDFDLAGIDIYLHFYNEIGERASFLIPENIEERIMRFGNSKLFYKHEERYRGMKVTDRRVQRLVDIIWKYRMEYEQEGYASPL